MGVYTKLASLYDIVSPLYKTLRKILIEKLDIKEGNSVLLIACGTGQSFSEIQKYLNGTGKVIAFDYSKEMLRVAQKKVSQNRWKNFELLQLDSQNMTENLFKELYNIEQFDIAIAELALSVIPNWREIIKITHKILKNNGKFGVLDWQRKNNDLITKIVNLSAEAQTTRKIREEIGQIFGNLEIVKEKFFKSIFSSISYKKI